LKDHKCLWHLCYHQTLIRCADRLILWLFVMFFQTLSSWSTSSVEEVNSVGPGIRFFQLYVCIIDMKLQEALLVLCSSDWPLHVSPSPSGL
jgi:hypothetical protein